MAGGIPAQKFLVDRPVDNLWIKRPGLSRLHFITSLFHSGAERLRFSTRFSTLAQENAVFVNANRSENDSHSGFFLWTKKIPISEDLGAVIFTNFGLIKKVG